MNASAAVQTSASKAQIWLQQLRANPRIPLIVAAAAAIAVVLALVLWARSPDYRVLYSNLSDSDGGTIVTQLSQMNIPYRFADNGGALMVPADKVHELRLKLASLGLPRGGAVGFELLDQEKFGISQFSEQVNFQRAMEGELARTIETLGPVVSARVHLALPRPTLFVREQKSPSASVTLTLQPGRALDDGQINAITHMVSSAVAGLAPGNVTVVDQTGRLLTRPDSDNSSLNDAQLKYTGEVENRLQQRIEAILVPLVGSGNVHAQVTAQLDFATKEQTDEHYGPNQPPNQAAVRSRQLTDNEQSGGGAGGVPGALSNQPAPANAAPIVTQNALANQQTGANRTQNASNSSVPRNSQHNETTNFEVDRTLRHTQFNHGEIQRLSVAVVVNYRELSGSKPLPLTKDQMAQIEALTREAMGFSAQRNDSLNVVNSPFTASDSNDALPPFWQQQAFIDLILDVARWLLIALVAWLLWRKAVRPQLQRYQAQQERQLQMQESARQQASEEEAVAVHLSKDEQRQQNKRLNAELLSERIRELSENDPRVVALVIRQWMSEEHE